jgi:pimeloyl-ACP methyl ester carboxylesterase
LFDRTLLSCPFVRCALLAFVCVLWCCRSKQAAAPHGSISRGVDRPSSTAAQVAPLQVPAVEVRTVPVPGDQPVFYLPSRHPTSERIVFLHGACVHGLGYLQAFQFAAAERASAIALQGDVTCHGIFRAWSGGASRIDARIAAAFQAAGDTRPLDDLVVVGYSQGALMAQHLAHEYPHRYSRVILIGEPRGPDASELRNARAVVAISGTRDIPGVMRSGASEVAATGVPATFIPIPGAVHGEMGDGNAIMRSAFAWIDAPQRPVITAR